MPLKDPQAPLLPTLPEGEATYIKSADAQRHKIAAALGRCIRIKGYAATSLTDIAIASEMSPSLMRYYFSTKEEILEAYYRLVSDRIMADLMQIKRESPEQWLGDFSKYVIVAGMNKASLSMLIEVFAVAVHHAPLANLKSRYDSFMERIYLEFFQWSGTARGIAPRSAARTARALELGIKMSALFQGQTDAKSSEGLFLSEMKRLAGMNSTVRSRP